MSIPKWVIYGDSDVRNLILTLYIFIDSAFFHAGQTARSLFTVYCRYPFKLIWDVTPSRACFST